MRGLRSLILTLLVAGCSSGDKAPVSVAARPLPLVTVVASEGRDLPITLRAPVELRPLYAAEVGSKTLGNLDAVLVDRGDRVRRGQVLALVRPSDLPDQLAMARGALAQNQAALGLARTNLDRAKLLAPEAVVSQSELQQAQSSVAVSEANEVAARAQIAALGVRLGETRIVSPMDGVVMTRRLDPGALVGPTQGPIVTVARLDVLRVFINVPEKSAVSVTAGKAAFVEVDALPGRRFSAKVVRVSPGFDPATRTLEAEVQLTNTDGDLRPGMYGRATLVLDTHAGAVVVPVTGVQSTHDRTFVFVHKDGVVKRRQIETGFDGDDILEVTRGLSAGEDIVVAGLTLIADGAKVRAVTAVPPPSPTAVGSAVRLNP